MFDAVFFVKELDSRLQALNVTALWQELSFIDLVFVVECVVVYKLYTTSASKQTVFMKHHQQMGT